MARIGKSAMAVVAAAGMILVSATSAFAEGSRNTYIGGFSPGADSSTWADSNSDTASTRVKIPTTATIVEFTNTSISWVPDSVQLQLQQDVWGVGWASQGNRTAAPGAYQNWGDNNWSGTFRFQYNGSTEGGKYYGYGSPHALFSGSSTNRTVYIGW